MPEISAESTLQLSGYKIQQAARLTLKLHSDLQKANPSRPTPAPIMVEHLLFNCPQRLLQGNDWEKIVYQLLCYLEVNLSPANENAVEFYRLDRDEPLFPNDESFDRFDAFLFIKSLLHYQRKLTRQGNDNTCSALGRVHQVV